MHLSYLYTFIEVVKQGNFSTVARNMGVSQPAISFQIHKLEQELGVTLLERNQKSLVVTGEGKRVLRFAETVLKEQSILIDDIERLRSEIAGTLLVAASTIPGEYILPPLINEFIKLHPAATIHLSISDSLTAIQQVKQDFCQLGFCGITPNDDALEVFPVAEDSIVLIVYPEHPFASRDAVTIKEALAEPLVCREETSGTRESFKGILQSAGIDFSTVKTRFTVSTPQAVISSVESKAGIAFVSSFVVNKIEALHTIKAVEISDLPMKRKFNGVYRKGQQLSRVCEEFIRFISQGEKQQSS